MSLDIKSGVVMNLDYAADQKKAVINPSDQVKGINTATVKIPTPSDNNEKNEQKDKKTDISIKKTVDDANRHLKIRTTKLEFTYYEDINRVAVKIIDGDTQEVIREIPTEKALEMIRSIKECTGLAIDEKR